MHPGGPPPLAQDRTAVRQGSGAAAGKRGAGWCSLCGLVGAVGYGERGSAESVVRADLTRAELVALKEAIELSPLFEGRAKARDAIGGTLRKQRPYSAPLLIDDGTAAALVRSVIVPTDATSASIHTKLTRALDGSRSPAPTG